MPAPEPNVYGPILARSDILEAVEATVKLWLPDYLGEVAAQHGRQRGEFPMIRSWKAAPTFELWPENQLPALVVVSPGTNSKPEMLNQEVTADWTIGAALVVSANTEEATDDLIGWYAAAVRALLVQKGSLGGFATGSYFMSERFDDHPIPEQNRTLRTAMVMFSVAVTGMNKRYGGRPAPGDPTVDPGPWPTITHVDERVVPL